MSSTTCLIGNLTSDAEIRFSSSGKAIASLTIAVSDRKFSRDTQTWEDAGTWFARCTAFGDMAENAAELTKGTRVIAFGRIQQRDWEDRDGNKRSSIEVLLDDIGPSLRYASAKVTKIARKEQQQGSGDPWASGHQAQGWGNAPTYDEIPF